MTTIVGVDCATDPRKVGLALAQVSGPATRNGAKARILAAEVGSDSPSMAARIAEWMGEESAVLLAMDAPLGWPLALGSTLAGHSAGELVAGDPNHLFRRQTDRALHAAIGKLPLDVGADRIARTAVAALRLLDELRTLTGYEIPLAWKSELSEPAAIEVYPAGTLVALGLRSSGYKEPGQTERRREILQALLKRIELGVEPGVLLRNPDVLDATLCIVAALDFLSGEVIPPDEPQVARREGWIWVRRPD